MDYSNRFDYFRNLYQLNYIAKDTLKTYVKLSATKPEKGITSDEYLEITGETYKED